MQSLQLWSVPFYEFHWEQHDDFEDDLKRVCYELEKQGITSGVAPGAKGGLYESPFNFVKHENPAVLAFSHWVKGCFFQAAKDSNLSYWQPGSNLQIELHESWCHITKDGGYHDMHTHPDSSWSAIYYLDIGDMRSNSTNGVNRFYNSNRNMYVDMGTAYMSANTSMDVEAEAGKLIIFPSWVPHSAITYRGDRDRLVIAVNCRITRANMTEVKLAI